MNAIRRIDPHNSSKLSISTENAAFDTPAPVLPPVIDSRALFTEGNEIMISHSGTHYRLKITRQGKLILTK